LPLYNADKTDARGEKDIIKPTGTIVLSRKKRKTKNSDWTNKIQKPQKKTHRPFAAELRRSVRDITIWSLRRGETLDRKEKSRDS